MQKTEVDLVNPGLEGELVPTAPEGSRSLGGAEGTASAEEVSSSITEGRIFFCTTFIVRMLINQELLVAQSMIYCQALLKLQWKLKPQVDLVGEVHLLE